MNLGLQRNCSDFHSRCQFFNRKIFNQSNFIRFHMQSAPFPGKEAGVVPSLYGKPQKKTGKKETVNNTHKQWLLLKLLKVSVAPDKDLIGH